MSIYIFLCPYTSFSLSLFSFCPMKCDNDDHVIVVKLITSTLGKSIAQIIDCMCRWLLNQRKKKSIFLNKLHTLYFCPKRHNKLDVMYMISYGLKVIYWLISSAIVLIHNYLLMHFLPIQNHKPIWENENQQKGLCRSIQITFLSLGLGKSFEALAQRNRAHTHS